MPRHALPGSDRQPMAGAQPVGKSDPAELCQVSVILRHTAASSLSDTVDRLASGDRSARPVRREDFAKTFGASVADMGMVRQFAAAHGLTVLWVNAARRTMVLSGTVAACNQAFGVDLQCFEHQAGAYRGRTGPLLLPDPLHGVVEAVLGLDDRQIARPYFRRRTRCATAAHDEDSTMAGFDPASVAALYGFPAGDGKGQCVGLIELGGGYNAGDLTAYFTGVGIQPTPRVIAVPVDGAANLPNWDPSGPDGEVLLDIEVLGAVAPAARIAVYFAPNTDAGFIDALTAAVHDTVNRPSVISISWGGPEPAWTPQAMTAFSNTLQAAAALGITVCAAAGDGGSGDGVQDGGDHADFPASSPYVLACGGSSLTAEYGAISQETAWNDSAAGGGAGGGGASAFFALPSWQTGLSVVKAGQTAKLTMRGVPDVCGNADPDTGYTVRIDGEDTVIGGTSAVAPLWAGLVARINATRGQPIGFVNPLLYRTPSTLRDITEGNNGDFAATVGWDACTGLGSPDGARIAAVLSGKSAT